MKMTSQAPGPQPQLLITHARAKVASDHGKGLAMRRGLHGQVTHDGATLTRPARPSMVRDDAVIPRRHAAKAALLVMEHGSLWPGRTLDWAEHVSVVLQPTRRSTDLTLQRVRRAVDARPVRLRSLECTVLTFADATHPALSDHRKELVKQLGAFLVEIGCGRLVLAAYHAERLELAELMALVNAPSSATAERLLVQVCFHRASRFRDGHARARR